MSVARTSSTTYNAPLGWTRWLTWDCANQTGLGNPRNLLIPFLGKTTDPSRLITNSFWKALKPPARKGLRCAKLEGVRQMIATNRTFPSEAYGFKRLTKKQKFFKQSGRTFDLVEVLFLFLLHSFTSIFFSAGLLSWPRKVLEDVDENFDFFRRRVFLTQLSGVDVCPKKLSRF